MSSALRVRPAAEPAPGPDLSLVPQPSRLPGPKLALVGVYALALAYHWLQSRAHVSPTVYPDELLYSKLAQGIVSGHGFSVRGETVLFPAPLAALAQAPAWLIHSTPDAYAVAKALNAALMSAAVFPAYAVARRLVRPSYALFAAALTVAGPPMLYGAYLMSEALAYPVFLLALATMLRAIERPSRRMEVAVVAVSLAAVLTRLQFVVVPIAYLVAAPLAGKLAGEPLPAVLRRHRVSIVALLAFGGVPLLTGGAVLGTYRGAAFLHYDIVSVLSWTGLTAALIPFAAGWLVVPGALLGLVLLAWRPRNRADAGFAALALACIAFVLLEIGLVGAGDAGRALERYAIYLVPLVAIAFFAYAERGAACRRTYVALAFVGAATAWLMPFPARVGTEFTFDTPTFSVYGELERWFGNANAATIFAGVPLCGGIALALLPLRRRFAPAAVGLATIGLLLLSGIPAYAGDHAVTRGALRLRAGDPPNWLDRSGLGSADYLQLSNSSAHFGWLLESWNRDLRHVIRLGAPSYDAFASRGARVGRDGRLLVEGREPGPGVLVVNDFGTSIDIEGRVVARPLDGLTAYRVPAAPHVRSLATGLYFDRWAASLLRFQAWPRRPSARGFYRVVLSLPQGHNGRTVSFAVRGRAMRTIYLAPGQTKVSWIPVGGSPLPVLEIRSDRGDFVDSGTPNARFVAVRVPSAYYAREKGPKAPPAVPISGRAGLRTATRATPAWPLSGAASGA